MDQLTRQREENGRMQRVKASRSGPEAPKKINFFMLYVVR